jgi:hypothetical protein
MEYPVGWNCDVTLVRLKQCLVKTQLLSQAHFRTVPPPEHLINEADERFEAEIQLIHEGTRKAVANLLERFLRWIPRERAAAQGDRQLALQSTGSPWH